MRVSIVVFPGTNCDHDVNYLYGTLLGAKVTSVWHRETDLKNPEVVIIPGGFSYGDYLRTGALAKISPVMKSISTFAKNGGAVIGICNGFQILCETQLLPGVLLRNKNQRFLSRFVHLKVENNTTPFSSRYNKGEVFSAPIAHGDGNFFADSETISRLEGEGQVVFRYCNANGEVRGEDLNINPNGSINSIAGICNKDGNVVGLMPHPERCAESIVGWFAHDSGKGVFG